MLLLFGPETVRRARSGRLSEKEWQADPRLLGIAALKHMHFRSFRFRQFISWLLPALAYPGYVWIATEESLKLLKLIDALTVMGLVFLIIGVVFSLVHHGDFDIMEYVAKRSLRKGDIKPFKAFKEDKKENRKDSFNYPFCVCLLLFLTAGILAFFVY